MASFAESEPVFASRCERVGLGEDDVKKLKGQGLTTLAKVAFCCSYTPGSGDDSELIKCLDAALGVASTLGQKASFRRLFHEAFSVTAQEMRSMVEQTEESAPRKLSVPERSERFDAITKRLPGLPIRNRLEPSDSVIDRFVGIYEANRLAYVEWDKLTSKEHEMLCTTREETVLSIDAQGKLTRSPKMPEPILRQSCFSSRRCSGGESPWRWRTCLTSICTASERLMSARLDSAPATHVVPSFGQLQLADRKLFQILAEHSRSGPQATLKGRPLDLIFETTWLSPGSPCRGQQGRQRSRTFRTCGPRGLAPMAGERAERATREEERGRASSLPPEFRLALLALAPIRMQANLSASDTD